MLAQDSPAAMPLDVDCVITCKGRLHHLQQTLPLLLAEIPGKVIVVDYDCPQGSGDWVKAHFPAVYVLRVTGAREFSLAIARNLGAKAGSSRWIFFLDADIKVKPGLGDWLGKHLSPAGFFRPKAIGGRRDPGTSGSFLCPREVFERIGGYDEVIRGWGGEDDDIYFRLARAGLAKAAYPADFLEEITHGNDERVRFQAIADKALQRDINWLYLHTKHDIARLTESEPSPATCRALMSQIRKKVLDWTAQPTALPELSVDFHAAHDLHAFPGFHAVKRLTVTVAPAAERGVPAVSPVVADAPRSVSSSIFQIYYDATSRACIDPAFTPLDNSENLRPDWFELWPIRKILHENPLEAGRWYGFLSPKFGKKTGLSALDVEKALAQCDAKTDVLIFPHSLDQIAYFQNVFEQGDFWHPGLMAVTRTFLDRAGIDFSLDDFVEHGRCAVFSNYLVARPAFWQRWLSLADRLFEMAEEGMAADAELLASRTSYGLTGRLAPMKAFVQERLASLVLGMGDFRIEVLRNNDEFPLNDALFAESETTRQMLRSADLLKQAYCTLGDYRYLAQYRALRSTIPTRRGMQA